jgi:Icc-related predicted phosphoesterase
VTHVTAIADLHGYLPALDRCDVLVIGGDVCPRGRADRQRAWLDQDFRGWLARVDAAAIVGVAGNCDLAAADDPELMRSLPWTYLENEAAQVDGLRVYGSPLSLPFGSWPFMAPDDELERVWSEIPTETELLVVHGPAYGLGDVAYSGAHVGSRSLRKRLESLPALRAFVCGHIHEAHGRGRVGNVEWVNAALIEDWQPEHEPELLRVRAPGDGL